MTRSERAIRKTAVFHVIYGEHCGATEAEGNLWRTLAVQYINGQRELEQMPMSLNALRSMLIEFPA